jgi:hypothetical protein
MASGRADFEPQPWQVRFKRTFARPWNYYVKTRLKHSLTLIDSLRSRDEPTSAVTGAAPTVALAAGDLVRVRSREEIAATLDRWQELKGCAFLDNMWDYCGTTQRVLKPMERFLDERDYKVKKCRGLVLLEGVICHGTPVFGRCDRCCHLFWRMEWLQKIEPPPDADSAVT